MASSAGSSDHDAEKREDEKPGSRFVVGPSQLRDGDFETLEDVREAIDDESSR